MRKHYLFLLAIFSIIIIGCNVYISSEETQTDAQKDDSMMKKDGIMEDKVVTSSDDAEPGSLVHDVEGAQEKEGAMMEKSSYTGKVLAGTETTKYLEFNKADYEEALKEKKKILLYFYANWCPICRVEQQSTFAAFDEVNDADLIGFRVNYRDSATDADEENLAKEFGVSYQHTKVILKDGQRAGKWPDSWDKQRYLDELAKI